MRIQPIPTTVAAPFASAGTSVKQGAKHADAPSSDAAAGHAPAAEEHDAVDVSNDAEQRLVFELTREEQAQVQELRQRDREVRTHEQAHVAAGGQYVRGGPTYEYEEGPDRNRYAVAGEVQIDSSPVPGDPEATIEKARVVRRAALAPAEPSSQDRAVAAAASQMEAQARAELLQLEQEERSGESSQPRASDAARERSSASSREEDAEFERGRLFDAVA